MVVDSLISLVESLLIGGGISNITGGISTHWWNLSFLIGGGIYMDSLWLYGLPMDTMESLWNLSER